MRCKVIDQYNEGGLTNVGGWDAADFAIGAIGTSAGVASFFGAAPLLLIGGAVLPILPVIAGAAFIYGASRFGYQLYKENIR